jgi:hypothetical protein
MKSSGLMVAALLLAGLSGMLYWSNHHTPEKDPAKSSAEAPSRIFTFNEADVLKIEIKKKDAQETVLTKNASGKWEITAPQVLGADQEAASSLLSSLSSLSADRAIEDKANNLNQYGLSGPVLEIDVTDKQNKAEKLLIGDDTPTGNAAYATRADQPRVFTIASYSKSTVEKGPNDLRDKRLLTIESDKVSRVTFNTKKEDIEFGRNKDQWQILKPRPLRADSTRVEDLIRKLTDAKMDLTGSDVDTRKTASVFGAGTPVAIARVTADSGTQQLEVRKNKEDYYARTSALKGVFKVSSDLGQALTKSLDDFRNKKLFDFGFDDPTKIEVREASKTMILTRSGQDWWSDGKKMDSASVQSFVDKIRDLSASRFIDSRSGAFLMDITVTSKEGRHIEKVLLSKTNNNYVAKRENESTLYELDAKAIEELQKSAGNVKAAVASTK